MRPLTPFVSYHDNLGRLLVGRVRFCNTDASPAEVFAEDGTTSLGNSVFTDSSGRIVQQPFLEDHDYLVFFDKYIGESNTMSEDDDPESWQEQGSAIDRYNTVNVSLDANSSRTIGTIEELRGTEAMSNGEIVVLLGYNTAGDKDPISYIWNPNSVENDDGGAVIKVQGVELGRWEMVECPRVLDVRHFGAFPATAIAENTLQRYRIQHAADYAYYCNSGLYFPSNKFAAFYDISGLRLHNVDCSPEARVFAVSDSHSTSITGIEKVYCASDVSCKGVIRLVDEVVRTSWESFSGCVKFAPTKRLVVDKKLNEQNVIFSGIEVEFLVSSNIYVRNCNVISNHRIDGPVTIEGCELDTSWFADNYDWRMLVSYNNTIRISNCKDANTYITLKNKQQEPDYGDLGEQTVSGVTLLANAIAENAAFSNVTITGRTELHNVSGTVAVSGAAYSVNFVDCWIAFTNSSGSIVFDNVTWLRGNVSSSTRVQILTSLYMEDVNVGAQIFTMGVEPQFVNCAITAVQHVGRLCKFIGCRIDADIVQYPETATYSESVGPGKYMAGEFLKNVWTGTAKLSLTPVQNADYSSEKVGVIGKYIGNVSDHDFVVDVSWDGVANAGVHYADLIYKDNHGGCPVESKEISQSFPYAPLVPSDGTMFDIPSSVSGNNGVWIVADTRKRSPLSSGFTHVEDEYWLVNLSGIDLDVDCIWRLRYLVSRYLMTVKTTVQASLRSQHQGGSAVDFKNSFDFAPIVGVDGTDTEVSVATSRPIRYEYVGFRSIDPEDIDESYSALKWAMYDAGESPEAYSATIAMRYSLIGSV